jgi:hypothetical protein
MTDDGYPDSFMVRGDQGPARPPAMDPVEQAAAFADRLLQGQTPEQAAIAELIYGRMKAGAGVDEVRDLIEQLSATHTRGRPTTGPTSPDHDHELRLYEDE